jgi:hypothetical protein
MSNKRVFVVIERLGGGIGDVSVYTTRSEAARAVGCNRSSIRGERVLCKGKLVLEVGVHTAKMGKAL